MRARACTLIGAASFLVAARAYAAPTVAIDLERDSTCPDRGDLFAELERRVPGATLTDHAAARHVARIVLAPQVGGGYVGTLTLAQTGDLGATSREVSGASCAEVGEALSLVLALAVEERETRARQAAPTPPPSPDEPRAPEAPPPRAPNEGAWRVALLARGEVRSAVSRTLAPGGAVGVELRRSQPGLGVAPSARATLGGSFGELTFGTGSRAVMRGLLLGIEGCGLRAATATERLSVDACARFEGGYQEAVVRPDGIAAGTGPWLSATALVRGRVVVIGGLFIELDGGIGAVLVRNRWSLGTAAPFYETPTELFVAGATLGFTIP